jgi:hypothetical protein
MTPAGIVQLGNGSAGARSDGAYALFVSGGTYDLVAQTMTAPRRLAIRRGITVAGTTTIAPIDVDREGVAMIDLPITVTGVPAGWQFTSGVDVATPSTEAVLFGIDPGATTLPIVPDGALQPTDHQNIFVALDTAGGVRLISRRVVPGGSTVFAVPPEYPVRYDIPTAQTTGRLTVHWETLAPYEQVHLLANQVPAGGTPGNIAHLLDVSASYLAITGDNHATFDTDIPGFDPSWRFDFQSSWHIAGSVTSTGANGADVVRADDLAIVSRSRRHALTDAVRGAVGSCASQRMDTVARIRIGPAIDPGAVGALPPQAVELALHAGVVRHLLAERAREAAGALVAGAAAEGAERLLGEGDPAR